MSQSKQYLTAIDIGTSKVVAIVGKVNEVGKIVELSVGESKSAGIKRGSVLNLEQAAQSINAAIEDLKKKTNVDFSEAYVGIAGQNIRSMTIRDHIYVENDEQMISSSDLDALHAQAWKTTVKSGEQIIHVLPQNYMVDGESGVHPVGMMGKKLEGDFHLVIGNNNVVKNLENCLSRLNIHVKKPILDPLATAQAILSSDEMEAGVAMVDIGAGTSDLVVYHDNTIRHTAIIPYGGNVITSDIKEGCAVVERNAEQLKLDFGEAMSNLAPPDKVVTIPGINGREDKEISFQRLADIIQVRLEEIIECIQFELQQSGYSDRLGAGIVITGGGAMLKNLWQLIRQKTEMDVRIGYPEAYIDGIASEEINHPKFSTSVGLLLKANEHYLRILEKMEQQKKEQQQRAQQPQAAPEPDTEETEEEPEEEQAPKKPGKKQRGNNFVDFFKDTIQGIFNEKDDPDA